MKPENILLTFDYKKHEIVDLKLCDFGLGAYFEPKVQLTDFCGSPGMYLKIIDICTVVGLIFLSLFLFRDSFCYFLYCSAYHTYACDFFHTIVIKLVVNISLYFIRFFLILLIYFLCAFIHTKLILI